jgi:uncharacterized phage-associated protein
MANSFTTQQIDKLGNTLIYLSQKVGDFNKTKILKLLYLLEESSIKKFGHPFFGFDFQLWKYGPVLNDVYIDLSEDGLPLLKDYIKRADFNVSEFEPVKEFSDDEFSDNDIHLMDTIINFARNKTARDLVEHTHTDNSLWKQSAINYGILEQLESQKTTSTNYLIDFSLLFEDNSFFQDRYEDSKNNLQFINHLKR